jgi:hypothetical protein
MSNARVRILRLAAAAVLLLGAAGAANAAQSFVYVALAAPACDAPPCAPGLLVVFDATTKEVVTSAPLGSAMNVPRGMAMSHGGARLYISLLAADGAASLAIFDTTRHEMGATYPLPAGVAGSVAVTGDDNRVFVSGPNTLVVWDVQTSAVLTTQSMTGKLLFAHPGVNHVIAAAAAESALPILTLYALDSLTGAVVTTKDGGFGSHVSLSPDGSRLYGTYPATSIHPSSGGVTTIYDPATLDDTGRFACNPFCFPSMAFDSPLANRFLQLARFGQTATDIGAVDRTTLSVIGTLRMPSLVTDGVVTGDGARFWAAGHTPEGDGVLHVVRVDTPALERTTPLPSSPLLVAATPSPGEAQCRYTVSPSQNSWAREGGTATVSLATGCSWIAASTANWLHIAPDALSGTGSRTLTVTVDPFFLGDPARSASVIIGGQIVRFTQAGFGAQGPFGSVDTPSENATGISGALAVTGWALDDVGVTRVRIFRDGDTPGAEQVFIGEATLVEGARPDVEAIFPALPFASRAGWGYQILTNMLPNGGNGVFRIHAYADDVDGHTTLLGSRTITADNSTATVPFGTLDTPGQGETVSGAIVNWGWALTPQPGNIPVDGSTIDVLVDGVVVGHPTFGGNRADIAALFPGYANTTSAVGYFVIDTTRLSDGVHTIAWIVRDNLGRASGIGSRYFTVRQ